MRDRLVNLMTSAPRLRIRLVNMSFVRPWKQVILIFNFVHVCHISLFFLILTNILGLLTNFRLMVYFQLLRLAIDTFDKCNLPAPALPQ